MLKQLSFATLFSVILLTGNVFAAEKQVNADKININTASVEVLQELKYIGKSTAEKIVAYRKQNGEFKSVDQLTVITGVGPRTIKANRDTMTIE